MKFFFPSNFDFQPKFLGLIDYPVLVFNGIWYLFTFCFLNLLFLSLNIKICLFILFCLPLSLFSIIGFNHENILQVFLYIIKFFLNRSIYLYFKE